MNIFKFLAVLFVSQASCENLNVSEFLTANISCLSGLRESPDLELSEFFFTFQHFLNLFSSLPVLSAWSPFRLDFSFGNSYNFGNFDSCLSLNSSTQHCLMQFFYKTRRVTAVPPPASEFNTKWKRQDERFGGAICVPSSCSAGDIQELMEVLFKDEDLAYAADYDQNHFCVKSEQKFSTGAAFWAYT